MTPRQWLPAVALDEVIPATADLPDDFLSGDTDGTWHIRPRDGDAHGQGAFEISLAPGQVVPFCFNDRFGTITVQVGEHGFSVFGDYPAHANCFFRDDDEGVFESAADLVENDLGPRLAAGTYQVEVYYWSAGVDFRFELPATGPQFVPVDGLPIDDEARR
ncbi:hypothetical protein [Antarcticirhabdus aurantiaca]|uniref:Uncharacterized protein n=1 Tax=Antarcticirhabdus aurantiaca TaxID=2606717 RepID=A0ACD4NR65_9HYPH|nr:hypothetical protein OXU80_03460 [Jeongeuplla avenae]